MQLQPQQKQRAHLLITNQQVFPINLPTKVQNQRSTILTCSHDASVIALSAKDPTSCPVLVEAEYLAGVVIGDANTLVI